MEPAGIIAISVTIVLLILAVLSGIGGVVLWSVARTRFLGPFVTFMPTLAMLGAVGGAWGLAQLVATAAEPWSEAPFLGWLVGLPVGGVVGCVSGLLLAFRSRSMTAKKCFNPMNEKPAPGGDCLR